MFIVRCTNCYKAKHYIISSLLLSHCLPAKGAEKSPDCMEQTVLCHRRGSLPDHRQRSGLLPPDLPAGCGSGDWQETHKKTEITLVRARKHNIPCIYISDILFNWKKVIGNTLNGKLNVLYIPHYSNIHLLILQRWRLISLSLNLSRIIPHTD